jgi:GNAT superfamily N-acetyltransferase
MPETFDWIEENPPQWDAHKAALFERVPAGAFRLARYRTGDLLPGAWWRVESAGTVVGYGWMDHNWGEAEVLLVVDPDRQRCGAGSFILDRLEREAAQRGLNYILNVVPPTHPTREATERWLVSRGFERHGDLLRRSTQRR